MRRTVLGWLSGRSQSSKFGPRRRRAPTRLFRVEELEGRILLHGDPGYELTDHVHEHLSIYLEGQNVLIPASIGVTASAIIANPHTHGTDGLLHAHPLSGVPPTDFPTLADFFDVWRTNAGLAGNNPNAIFNQNQIMDRVVDATHTIGFFVNGAPNAEFEDYVLRDGDQIVISYEAIAAANAPTLNPIGNLTMLAGQVIPVPLNAFDPNGSPLSFQFVVNLPQLTGQIPTANRSLRLNVSGTDHDGAPFSGDLILELYEQALLPVLPGRLTPQTTARIIELANQGFYDGLTFHRVIEGFMAQGGDPLGNGTGGSGLDFDDEFDKLLTFTGFGQLAMANSGDDTNDSQFFITDNNLSFNMGPSPGQLPPRHLNFNHTIFGQLVDGFNVLENIMRTPVTGSTPNSPVRINTATVFTDNQNGVLMLFADPNFTGTATVTVTATNGSGLSDTQTFLVQVIEDTVNDRAFLAPVANQVTNEDTPVSFTLAGSDLENDPLTFVVRDSNNFANPPSNVQVSINQATGQVTLTPAANFHGAVNLLLGVRDQTARDNNSDGAPDALDSQGQFDTQRITLTVNSANERPSAASATVVFQPNVATTIQLSGDDGDADASQTLTFELLTQPANGTLSNFNASTGTVDYTANAGFTGTDSFTFRVRDNGGTANGGQDISAAAAITLTGSFDPSTNPGNVGPARLRRGQVKLNGTNGNDTIEVFQAGDRLVITLNGGLPQSFPLPDVHRLRLYGRRGDDVITIASDVTTPAFIKGGKGNDTITSGAGDDRISGGRGNDVIDAGDGNDRVHGNRGDDSLLGGTGDDRMHGDRGNDSLIGGLGNDWLRGDSGHDSVDGGSGDDILIGDAGNDTFDGGDGNDRIRAGPGADSVDGGAGADTLRGGSGFDTNLDPDLVDAVFSIP